MGQKAEEVKEKVEANEMVDDSKADDSKGDNRKDRNSKATLISTTSTSDDAFSDTNTKSAKKPTKKKSKKEKKEEKEKTEETEEKKEEKKPKKKLFGKKEATEENKEENKEEKEEGKEDGDDAGKKKPKHHMHKAARVLTEVVVALVSLGMVGALVMIIFYNIIMLLQEFNLERSSCSLRVTIALTTHVVCFILMITKPLFPDAGGANVTVHAETKTEAAPAEAAPAGPPAPGPGGPEAFPGENQLMDLLPGHAQMIATVVQMVMTQLQAVASKGTLMVPPQGMTGAAPPGGAPGAPGAAAAPAKASV